MADTTKPMSKQDANQVLQYAFNDNDRTIAVSGFVASKIGHKVTRTVVNSLTDDYTFLDGSNVLYVIRVVYNNSSHDEINSAERIS